MTTTRGNGGLTPAELHSAGAIVRHESPFSKLEVPQRMEFPPQALIDRWIKPLYMDCFGDLAGLEEAVRPLYCDVNGEVVGLLLSYFNWRPRVVGACLAALRLLVRMEDTIGRLLLRSDVCYAGQAYCLALARLNGPTSADYLARYLQYYLTRPDLWFDQMDALAALNYLDEVNGTMHAQQLMPSWHSFAATKPNWNLAEHESRFRTNLRALDEAASHLEGAG